MTRWLPCALALLFIPTPALASSFKVGMSLTWHRTEVGTAGAALLVIELPLERLALPRSPFPSRGLQQEATPERAAPPRPEASPAPPRTKVRSPKRESRLLDPKFARSVVRAALRARGAGTAAERFDSLTFRSRAAAVLPELTLRALRSNDQSLRLSPTAATAYDYTQTGGAGLLLEARAVWRLDRLVFADEELRVEGLRAQQLDTSERIVALVLKQLFALRRARALLADEALAPEERLRTELELLEAATALDVLTDGAFSELDPESSAERALPTEVRLSGEKG